MKSTASGTFFPPHHSLALKCADLPTHKPHCLDTLYQRRALSILLRPHFIQTTFGGTGISTCCPSTTAFALALGPDLPRADQLYSGNLRYSADRILTCLSLLMPTFSLLYSPRKLTFPLRPVYDAPLPYPMGIQSFGGKFQPRLSSAQSHSTSELLRTL